MNDFIDNFAYCFFFIIDSDIEDKIIFFISIVSMSDLIFIFFISCVDSSLGNESGQLEFIFGNLIECVDIEIEQEDKRYIDQ